LNFSSLRWIWRAPRNLGARFAFGSARDVK
jgi:hypothetical protein